MFTSKCILVVLAAVVSVNAHGKLQAIQGANGVTANGLAIVPSTPNTGKTKAIEADTTILGAKTAKAVAAATGCGKTQGGGVIDCNQAAAVSLATSGETVPTANSDGTVDLTFHQVNGDGAGPLTAAVSTDMGKTWQQATVLADVPGTRGRSQAKNIDVPVKVQVPAGTSCAGTSGSTTGVCLVALANPVAGFGGSAPFAMSAPAAAPAAAAPAPVQANSLALSADEIATLNAEGVDQADFTPDRRLARRSPALEPAGSWTYHVFKRDSEVERFA
ncbi:hypothetical protein RQP46_008919 [Phenoliferia psychrophenolica]